MGRSCLLFIFPRESQQHYQPLFLPPSDAWRRFLLHRTSGPYLSPFVAHAKITIACARYLLNYTEFTTGALSPTACGHIIKGFHDIFPYVQEFWPEHLTKCVDSKGDRDDEIWKAV